MWILIGWLLSIHTIMLNCKLDISPYLLEWVFLFISYRSYYCIETRWSDKHCLSYDMFLYQVIMMLHFLNDIVKDIEST